MGSTAAPYTESRLARLVRNKRVGFPVVEQSVTMTQAIFNRRELRHKQLFTAGVADTVATISAFLHLKGNIK